MPYFFWDPSGRGLVPCEKHTPTYILEAGKSIPAGFTGLIERLKDDGTHCWYTYTSNGRIQTRLMFLYATTKLGHLLYNK